MKRLKNRLDGLFESKEESLGWEWYESSGGVQLVEAFNKRMDYLEKELKSLKKRQREVEIILRDKGFLALDE